MQGGLQLKRPARPAGADHAKAPYPDPHAVKTEAARALAAVQDAARQLDKKRDDEPFARALIRRVVQDKRSSEDPSWDRAEQLYLALQALNQSQRDPKVAALLQELTPIRAFSPGFDSPHSFPAKASGSFDSSRMIQKFEAIWK